MLASGRAVDPVSGAPVSFSGLADDWYGQCWSLLEESDAMWRIYSPKASDEAIKVKTTIRKLFANLTAAKTPAARPVAGAIRAAVRLRNRCFEELGIWAARARYRGEELDTRPKSRRRRSIDGIASG